MEKRVTSIHDENGITAGKESRRDCPNRFMSPLVLPLKGLFFTEILHVPV